MEATFESRCPCCGSETIVEFHQAKWEGENDRVVITHKKWVGPLEPKSLDMVISKKYNKNKYPGR